jgi:hypothetical protein
MKFVETGPILAIQNIKGILPIQNTWSNTPHSAEDFRKATQPECSISFGFRELT